MPRPERLFGLASDVLGIAVASLTATDAGCPNRSYVSDGPLIAWDCEQVVVSVERVYGTDGDVSAEVVDPVRCLVMRAAMIGVWVVRCAPTMDDDGNAPTAAAIHENAEVILADPMVVFDGLLAAHRAGDLSAVGGLAFEQWEGVGPDGGLVGGVLRLRVDLATV